ncbi:protein of unknown function [Rhodovastum atsumiense]|nr:periplasmic heavy metal sensor [Rhodovastum atsumiense]CAH2601975.1 protein of unknown function [Rhodovastum atsumiense]
MTLPRHPAPRWRRFLLPASLLLNLFLVAVIVGQMARSGLASRPHPSLTGALAKVEALFSAQDAAAFRAVIRRDAPEFAGAARQMLEARQNLEHLVIADRYDPAAVREGVVIWRRAWNHFFDRFGDTLVDAMAQVSPEGRRRLIAARQRWNAISEMQRLVQPLRDGSGPSEAGSIPD